MLSTKTKPVVLLIQLFTKGRKLKVHEVPSLFAYVIKISNQ